MDHCGEVLVFEFETCTESFAEVYSFADHAEIEWSCSETHKWSVVACEVGESDVACDESADWHGLLFELAENSSLAVWPWPSRCVVGTIEASIVGMTAWPVFAVSVESCETWC